MFEPCNPFFESCITILSRYLTKWPTFPDELMAIVPPWRPWVWLAKRQILVWSKQSTIDLSGGTINTAANDGCIWWCCMKWSSRSLTVKKPRSEVISSFFKCLSFFPCWRTCLTSKFGCWTGRLKESYNWFPFIMTLVYIGIVMWRSCNCVGIWRVPSRKSSAASTAITVQVLLPLGLPPMEDWQMYEGSSHSVTSRCCAIVTFMRRVVWESGVGNEADWLLQVLWLLSCWFAVCHEQGQFELLMSSLTVQVPFSQK